MKRKKKRHCAYRKATFSGLEEDQKIYRRFRNQTVQVIRKKKQLYYQNLIDGNKNLSMISRLTIYKSIIAPGFKYFPTMMLYFNEKSKLQISQNRVTRIILKLNRYIPI